jgi:5-methylcytosine-specific restriction enzyme subunit McrC
LAKLLILEKTRGRVESDIPTEHKLDKIKKIYENDYSLEKSEVIRGIKGKLNFSETVKAGLLQVGQTKCEFDEFDYDSKSNQIVKATIAVIEARPDLDKSIRANLNETRKTLAQVSDIIVTRRSFSSLRLTRGQQHCALLLKICQLIVEHNSITSQAGENHLNSFLLDTIARHQIYENFIRNFFKIKLKNKARVTRSDYKWSI